MFKTHHCNLKESRLHTTGFLRLLVLESLESCWAGGRRGPSAAVPMLWSAGDWLFLPPPDRCAWPELTPASSTAPITPCATHRETLPQQGWRQFSAGHIGQLHPSSYCCRLKWERGLAQWQPKLLCLPWGDESPSRPVPRPYPLPTWVWRCRQVSDWSLVAVLDPPFGERGQLQLLCHVWQTNKI